MAIQNVNLEYNSFIKGIVTEANALTFPENASIDEANFLLNRDGSRQRRLGMDFESEATAVAVPSMTSTAVAVSSHEWNNAGNTIANQFAVVQVGDKLLVYNAQASTISSNLIATIDASSVILDATKIIQTASGMGFLFITSGTGNPSVLEYVGTTVTLREIPISIRDFFGVYSGLAIDTKPATLSDAHKYNLYNQGWDFTKVSSTFSARSTYPSNTEIWFIAKDTNDDFQAGKLAKNDFGTSAASKGRYIIDAFNRSASRSARSGVNVPTDIEPSRPSCVGFFQQRVWYSGVDGKQVSATDTAPSMTGYVFYSRIIRTPQDFGQCHSDTDPTSEHDNSVGEPDGGYINIPDSGKIYKIVTLVGTMYVFAQNGVWAITGGDQGFNAVQQQVQRVTDFGVFGSETVVKTEDSIVYWSKAGIYLLSADEGGGISSKNISQSTVHSLFTALPKANKANAVGNYDPINRKVSWLYSTDLAYDGINYKYKFDTELVLDTTLGAFSKNKISAVDGVTPFIAGYLTTPDLISAESLGSSVTKYLTMFYELGSDIPNILFSHYRDKDFVDWKSYNGVGVYYSSYLLTGYDTLDNTLVNKQAPYIITHFKRTESGVKGARPEGGGGTGVEYIGQSSCILQSRWDFADSATSGKWGPETEVYRLNRSFISPEIGEPLDYGHSVITTKNRLTGRGKALSLMIRSNRGYDMHILGWAIRYTQGTVV